MSDRLHRCSFVTLPTALLLVLHTATPAALAACTVTGAQVDIHAPAAGCLIKNEDRMLSVRHRFSGKLGMPAGYAEARETAPCAAQRETLEEAGLKVSVGELLKLFDHGFQLYRCHLLEPSDVRAPLGVPMSGLHEISEVLWLDPSVTQAQQWRFPKQWPAVLELFLALD